MLVTIRRHAPLTLFAFLLLTQLAVAAPLVAQQGDPQPATQGPAADEGVTKVETEATKTTTWTANPTWVVIGLVGLALIVALFVVAGRSRHTTTIVK